MTFRSRRFPQDSEPAGLTAATKALKLPKGPPTEYDRPPVRPLPGRKPKVIPGQLDFDGDEAA